MHRCALHCCCVWKQLITAGGCVVAAAAPRVQFYSWLSAGHASCLVHWLLEAAANVNFACQMHVGCSGRSATRPLVTSRGCGPTSNASHLTPGPTAFVRRPLCVCVYCKTLATTKLLLSCTHTSRNYLPPSFSRPAHNATSRQATAHEHVLRTMHNHSAHCQDYDSQLCPGKISFK